MNKNYQLELDRIIEEINDSCVPTLLLHSCCAPCSTYVLEYLSKYFEITIYYYNPNIYPPEEFEYRMEEQKRFVEEFLNNNPDVNPIHFIAGEYESDRFYEVSKGLENEPERGLRCTECFKLRLGEAAKVASKNGFDYFTTTLSISPHKDANLLNILGENIAKQYGIKYLYSDFKKKGGFLRSTEISKEYNMYRQDYCGCVFSYRERHST